MTVILIHDLVLIVKSYASNKFIGNPYRAIYKLACLDSIRNHPFKAAGSATYERHRHVEIDTKERIVKRKRKRKKERRKEMIKTSSR